MIDFTSSLYLGLLHETRSLAHWDSLTTGAPAALRTSRDTHRLQEQLAALQGCERATVAPSTLHLFWDLFGMWPIGRTAICFDEAMYPIGKWGVERAAASGIETRPFRHHDDRALRKEIEAMRGYTIVVATDGYCTSCASSPPLDRYERAVEEARGYLLIDDTQSTGIFGVDPSRRDPYGLGGGGSMRRFGLHCRRTMAISSLAKAFGAPIAALAGSDAAVGEFEWRSKCRVHCSQPSAAHIAAARRALDINARQGDGLRRWLATLVGRFQTCCRKRGIVLRPSLFPVQSIRLAAGEDPRRLESMLHERGIQSFAQMGKHGGPRLGLIITTLHSEGEIEKASDEIARVIQNVKTGAYQ